MSPPSSRNKTILAVVKIGLSAAILGYLFRVAQKDHAFAEVAARDKLWHWLILAFALCLLAHLISFFRWKLLVRALDIPFSTLDAVRIGFIGLFFGLFAFGVVGGDTLRVYYAARHARKRLPEVICTVFADRAIGMLTMFTIATIGFLVIGIDFENAQDQQKVRILVLLCWLVSTATIVGWMVVAGFLLAPNLVAATWPLMLRRFSRVQSIVKQLSDAVLLYRRRLPTLAYSVALSVLVNLCFVGTIYLIAIGLQVEHPSLSKHLLIAPISMAANAVPLPGGLGGMELVLSYFYDALSVSSEESKLGIVVAFSFRFALLTLAVAGAVAWFVNRKQIESVMSEQNPNVNL